MMHTQDIRWKHRLAQYQQALAQLRKFVDKGALNELEQLGLVKAFEVTHELAWKVMKEYFEYQGNSSIAGSRDATRSAYQAQLIEDPSTWLDMITQRNKSSHTCQKQTADDIADLVMKRYYRSFLAFQQAMKEIAASGTMAEDCPDRRPYTSLGEAARYAMRDGSHAGSGAHV